MTRTIHPPGSCTSGTAFTVETARQFLATWCRVVDADGSTVGYVPDEQTAKELAGVPTLLAACERALRMLTYLTTKDFERGGDKEARDILQAALRAAKGE